MRGWHLTHFLSVSVSVLYDFFFVGQYKWWIKEYSRLHAPKWHCKYRERWEWTRCNCLSLFLSLALSLTLLLVSTLSCTDENKGQMRSKEREGERARKRVTWACALFHQKATCATYNLPNSHVARCSPSEIKQGRDCHLSLSPFLFLSSSASLCQCLTFLRCLFLFLSLALALTLFLPFSSRTFISGQMGRRVKGRQKWLWTLLLPFNFTGDFVCVLMLFCTFVYTFTATKGICHGK